jgi:predicted glycogen debranching enzyme
MFVLNALLHSDKNIDVVERILRKYQAHLKDGLIPSVLPESGREILYESIDATLWYIILLYKLGKKKNRNSYWEEIIKTSHDIIKAIIGNQTYPFNVRNDGLIELLPGFASSTWMDAKAEGNPVTARDDATVEINALWYNAICSYEDMCTKYNLIANKAISPDDNVIQLKTLVLSSFQKFWVDDYLADRLIGDEPVKEFRPNSLLATALPWQMLTNDKLEKLFAKSFKELYTFYGMRSLSPSDLKFRKKYYGNQRERDLSLHNGSVWAWLLGAFCGLYVKVNQDKKTPQEIASDLSNFVSVFRNGYMRGHIASIAEIWDGDSPHFPKGSPAMAWSVAALYNIETYIASLEGK